MLIAGEYRLRSRSARSVLMNIRLNRSAITAACSVASASSSRGVRHLPDVIIDTPEPTPEWFGPMITTERLILRHWKASDLPEYIAMNKDKDVMRVTIGNLAHNMVLERSLYTMSGALLLRSGSVLTPTSISRIRTIAQVDPIAGEIYAVWSDKTVAGKAKAYT